MPSRITYYWQRNLQLTLHRTLYLMKTPLFNWLTHRATGVLVHPTSLPGDYGVGTLGAEAHDLIEFMVEAGLSYWQLCPLNPTGVGDSPYSSFSAFAGNPYLIDTTQLVEAGLLEESDQDPLRDLPHDHTDYDSLFKIKWPILNKAYQSFFESKAKSVDEYGDYNKFVKANDYWLHPYAAYMACKHHFDEKIWSDWPKEYRSYESAGKTGIFDKLEAQINAYMFYQYIFYGQWSKLRTHANRRGVHVIGDIPIFVSFDSADIWANKSIFQVNAQGKPTHVAGVPPDYFSETGQLWGNPLYDWKTLKTDDYDWWMRRFEQNFALYDVVRLDHFRGFYDYWKIPAKANDAREGKWAKGPQMDFFKTLAERFENPKIIAEDLGDNMGEVFKFRDSTGLPGMAILQFAFGGDDGNPYLPHNIQENSVVYTGTHDNNTSRGWFEEAPQHAKEHAMRVCEGDGSEMAYDFIRTAYKSRGRLAIVPIQDFMDLPASARFNVPGTAFGNWKWRYQHHELDRLRGETTGYLRKITEENGRVLTLG